MVFYGVYNDEVFCAMARVHLGDFSGMEGAMVLLYCFVARYDKLDSVCKQERIAQD